MRSPFRRFIPLLVIGAFLASVVTPAGSQGGVALGDGNWRVVFFIEQDAVLGGVDFHYAGHGSAIVNASDESVTGEWNLNMATVVIGTPVTTNGVSIGTVSGTTSELVLDLTSVTATDANGLSLTFTADELPESGAGTLQFDGFGCSALTGEWAIPLDQEWLVGEVIAQRLGIDGGETDADLRDDGLAIIEQAQTGTIDLSTLRSFIARAEAGSEATARDSDCSPESSRVFANAATLLLNTVLYETAFGSTEFDDAQFIEFYRVVLRSGLFEAYPETRLAWEHQLIARMNAALRSEDPAVWRFWVPIAEQFGEGDFAQQLRQKICSEQGERNCTGETG